jgi:ketosteroid isomerase-like protein
VLAVISLVFLLGRGEGALQPTMQVGTGGHVHEPGYEPMTKRGDPLSLRRPGIYARRDWILVTEGSYMSVATTAKTALDAFRAAMEGQDFDALESCYAEDAVYVSYSERNRPSSAEELCGRQAIGRAFRDAPGELTHELQDEVAGENRFAFTLKCTYPTGELVMATSVCEVRDHLITRQTGVEAWDE